MNNLNRRVSVFMVASIFFAAFVQVNAQEDQRMQRFKEEKMSYFNENLQMSEELASVFWPIYEDLNNRRMKIGEEEKTLITYYSSNADYMTEKELDETIKAYLNIQQKRVDLDLQFHNKFVETIGKAKTMKMYTLEREFRLFILRKFRGGGQGPNGPRGQGRGRGRQ